MPAPWRAAALLAALATAAPAAETGSGPVPEIVVTAGREPTPWLTLIGNTTRIGEERLQLLGSTHPAELGTQAPGTWLSRGSEQESLPAIRSPVLTGPGSCGAFLMLEDGIPVRPAGFCNVNQLFEILTEQATAMEVVRGPSGTLYGANSLHGTLNFLLPGPQGPAGFAGSAEAGPNQYWRGIAEWRGRAGEDPLVAGLLVNHDGDFRQSAGYDQAKAFVKLEHDGGAGPLLLGFSGTVLDQETAGYISETQARHDEGYRAYADTVLRRQNLNPESYRDADSQRLYVRWRPAAGMPLAGTDLRFFLRRSRMDFLQHYLPGKPREENGQWSGGLMATRRDPLGGLELVSGLDLEVASGFLRETQAGDSGIGSIPPGKHYDYDVASYLAGAFAELSVPLGAAWTGQLGLRVEYMAYDYSNNMLDGNTRDDGTPCTPAPCRFSRPADRSDDFLNVAPTLGVVYRIGPGLAAYAKVARGFRPPQATELYRLQAQQQVADISSETLDSAELGLHWLTRVSRVELATFLMKKRNYIFQDASRFNVSDGRTRHRGVELTADLRLPSGLYAGVAGSVSRQTYAYSALTPGGEEVRSGDDIDTAPRTLGSARVGIDRGRGIAELEWVHVGRYYLDAANLTDYAGHDLVNLRGAWRLTPRWTATLRVNNLADRLYAERADFVSFPAPSYRYFPGRRREIYLELAFGTP